jgi:hypothetical protein
MRRIQTLAASLFPLQFLAPGQIHSEYRNNSMLVNIVYTYCKCIHSLGTGEVK